MKMKKFINKIINDINNFFDPFKREKKIEIWLPISIYWFNHPDQKYKNKPYLLSFDEKFLIYGHQFKLTIDYVSQHAKEFLQLKNQAFRTRIGSFPKNSGFAKTSNEINNIKKL